MVQMRGKERGMNALSLFSGIGGIDLACEWAGIKTVAFCEREPFCQKVLRKHWPNVPIYDDVCTLTKARLESDGIDCGTIDLIHGGYPCQPFSYAGKRRGAEDDRHLWPEYFRLVQEIRPRWVVGENVAGHVTLGLDDVLSDLESLDYTAQAFVIPAAAVYASHRRDRIFVVAYASGGKREPRPEVERVLRALHENGTEHHYAYGPSSAQSGQNVAYSASEGLQKWGQSRFAKAKAEDGAGMEPEFERCGEDVADTCDKRRQECDASASGEGVGQHSQCADSDRTSGSTQSSMGRDTHELSAWLDGGGLNPLDALADFIASYPQPALIGQPQYDWEPPRVAIGVKNRAARLKALGNAVDPLQIFPIMYAIKIIDDWVMSQ